MKITKLQLKEMVRKVVKEQLKQNSKTMTVGRLKQILSKHPDEMPVAFSHEIGTLDITSVETLEDQVFQPREWGGDWQYADTENAEEAMDILLIS